MKTYTVLLLYPEFMTDSFGTDTYMTSVQAEDVKNAQRAAQQEMVDAHQDMEISPPLRLDDFEVIMVIEGQHSDIKEPT
jgi:hypothetical protein